MVDEPDDLISGSEDYNPADPADQAKAEEQQKQVLRNERDDAVKEIEMRQRAFRRAFPLDSDDMRIVMKDLRPFCRADMSAWAQDQRVHALLTGRQEVYLRIMDYLTLPLDDLVAKHLGE